MVCEKDRYTGTAQPDKIIFNHDSVYYVAVAYEVRDKCDPREYMNNLRGRVLAQTIRQPADERTGRSHAEGVSS